MTQTAPLVAACNAMENQYGLYFPAQQIPLIPYPPFHGHSDRMKQNSSRFYPLFHRVLSALEVIGGQQNQQVVAARVAAPLDKVPKEYIHNKLRSKLICSKFLYVLKLKSI